VIPVLGAAGRWFDALAHGWHGARLRRALGDGVVLTFVAGLLVIEANRQGWLPADLAARLPRNHFHAVDLAFRLLLLIEVVDLVFSLGESVANSLGKQFEVFSLILLRQSFKELTGFQEPVRWAQVGEAVGPMAVGAAGALLLFAAVGLYYRLQRHRPITDDAADRRSFVEAKKLIALALLAAFAGLALHQAASAAAGRPTYGLFEAFYTVLIFSDVLIVLLSLRTASRYEVVFRNSGFAAATVFLRLALTAPPYVNAALGLLAVALACGLSLVYSALFDERKRDGVHPPA
jgi:hypothetical protein